MRRSTPHALYASALVKCYRAGLPDSPAVVHALRGVDLELGEGEILGVVGAPGAGKSTLLLCAAGLLRPDAGILRWFGEERASYGRPYGVMYVAECPRYYPFLTAREALEHYAVLHELPGRDRGVRVATALARTGLAEQAGTQVRRLTAAMLQRLGLAQGIVAASRLLLLDDALSALDPVADGDVPALLRELCARGVAVVVASRDARRVAPLAGRVLVLAEGRVIATTDHSVTPAAADRPARVAEARQR